MVIDEYIQNIIQQAKGTENKGIVGVKFDSKGEYTFEILSNNEDEEEEEEDEEWNRKSN